PRFCQGRGQPPRAVIHDEALVHQVGPDWRTALAGGSVRVEIQRIGGRVGSPDDRAARLRRPERRRSEGSRLDLIGWAERRGRWLRGRPGRDWGSVRWLRWTGRRLAGG